MSRIWPVVALVASATLGCGDSTCTEAACEHQAVVTFPAGLLNGAYDLTLAPADGPLLSARCSDPGAPELADNAEGLTCNATGFEVVGDAARSRSVLVTVTDTDSGDVLVGGIEVRLDAVDEIQPNGPDCPPTCFVRNGQLAVAGP